jgi:hypothetical protein
MKAFRPNMPVQSQLTEQTGQRYQKKLAVAYCLREAGQSKAFEYLHPEEQTAAVKLASVTRITPEAKRAMENWVIQARKKS